MEPVPNPSADPTPSPRKRKAANSEPSSSAESTPSDGSEAGPAPKEPARDSTPPLLDLKQLEASILIPCDRSASGEILPIAHLTLYEERNEPDGSRARVIHSNRSVELDSEERLAGFINPRYPNVTRVTIALHTPFDFIEYHEHIDEVLSYFMSLMSESCRFRIATKFTDGEELTPEARRARFKKANDYVYDELVALARPYQYQADWVKVNGRRWGLKFDPYVVTWKRLPGWSERDILGFLAKYAREKGESGEEEEDNEEEEGKRKKKRKGGKRRRKGEPEEEKCGSKDERAPSEKALEKAAKLVEQGALAPTEADPSALEADDEDDTESEDDDEDDEFAPQSRHPLPVDTATVSSTASSSKQPLRAPPGARHPLVSGSQVARASRRVSGYSGPVVGLSSSSSRQTNPSSPSSRRAGPSKSHPKSVTEER